MGAGRLAGRRGHRGPWPGQARQRGALGGGGAQPARRRPRRPRSRHGPPHDGLPGCRLPRPPQPAGRGDGDRPHGDAGPGRVHQGHAPYAVAAPQPGRSPPAQPGRLRGARAARCRQVRRDGAAHRGGRHPRVPRARVRRLQARPARRPPLRANRPARPGHPLRRRRAAHPQQDGRLRLAQDQDEGAPLRQADRQRADPALQRPHGDPGPRLRPRHPVAARARGRVRLRRDPRPAELHRRGEGRHGALGAHGPAHLRRRRLRQDRDRRPRGLQGDPGRQAGRGARADDPAGPAAPADLHRALRPVPGRREGTVPIPERQGGSRGHRGSRRRKCRPRHRHPPPAVQGHPLQGPRPGHRRRGTAVRRRAQGAAQDAAHRR